MADEVIHQNPEVTDEFRRAAEIEDKSSPIFETRSFYRELTREEVIEIASHIQEYGFLTNNVYVKENK